MGTAEDRWPSCGVFWRAHPSSRWICENACTKKWAYHNSTNGKSISKESPPYRMSLFIYYRGLPGGEYKWLGMENIRSTFLPKYIRPLWQPFLDWIFNLHNYNQFFISRSCHLKLFNFFFKRCFLENFFQIFRKFNLLIKVGNLE